MQTAWITFCGTGQAAEQLIGARLHMSMQVYFHRNTRRWEAHLLCLFHEAARLASGPGLPGGTLPAIVEYFAKKGAVDHANFLQVDEASLLACLGLWASQTDAAFALQARLAAAFLNREKLLLCREFNQPDHLSAQFKNRLKAALTGQVGPEMSCWVADWIPFKSYNLSEPIYLSEGGLDSVAESAQNSSFLFRAYGGSDQPSLARLYFLPEYGDAIETEIAKIL